MTVVGEQMLPRHPIDGVNYAPEWQARRWLNAEAWLPQTIGATLDQAARDQGSATAIVDPAGRYTYSELRECSVAVAQHLLACGLEPGDRVLVQVGTDTTAVVWLLGLFWAGLVPVCAVPRYGAYEMGAITTLTRASAHIVESSALPGGDLVRLGVELRAQHDSLHHLVVTEQSQPFNERHKTTSSTTDDVKPTLPPSPFDVAALQLSGGTTGVPKVIPRFHAEYLGYAAAWARLLQLSTSDVLLWSLPVTHNAGMLCFLLPTLLRRATLVLMPRFDAGEFLDTIEREQVTVTASIGPITPRLLDVTDPRRHDLSSLRLFLTLNRAREIEQHLGVRAMNNYGITEGLLVGPDPDSPPAARHETIGFAASPHDEVRILVPGDERPAEDGFGELCFRGPSTLRSYYHDPQATRQAFTADGFFRTGDLVRVHQIAGRSHLSFEGRIKDNIDRGGEKFGTEQIEALLAEHPAVYEARVVGMPDRYLGERVCAFVVARPGAALPTVTDLAEFLLVRGLAKFKLPERVETISEMPVTAVGKLDRPALRQLIAERLVDEGAR